MVNGPVVMAPEPATWAGLGRGTEGGCFQGFGFEPVQGYRSQPVLAVGRGEHEGGGLCHVF